MSDWNEKDSKAVQRFKQGDPGAFEELMLRYEKMIYAFLMRMCGSPEQAKDNLQDTFLTVYRYLPSFRGEASFKTWLYRIATTTCLRNRRRKKNEPAHHLSLDELVPGRAELSNGLEAGWADSTAEELLNSELREKIMESQRSLPDKYNAVFALRDVEGFSAEDVARMLDISVPAVKSRLHRARLFMRKELAEYYLTDKQKETTRKA